MRPISANLVSGVLEDEGYQARTASLFGHRARGARRTPPQPGPARRLAAGVAARWPRPARRDQAARSQPAGHRLLGPRQYRHGGGRGARGRGRFHREAVRKLAPCSISSLRATETDRLRRENADLRAQVGQDDELTGTSQAINHVRATLKRVAGTGSRVLISGPAGAGKEVAARLLHNWSQRERGAVRRRLGRADDARARRGGIVRGGGGGRVRPPRFVRAGRMAAPCSSTRSPTCRSRPRPRSCAC